MRALLTSLGRSQSGAAAAEMALVTPLLMVLMFGSFELGNYFYSEHVVAKAVRDGARYASRAFALNADCTTPPASVVTNTRNIARTGRLSGGTARLAGWTDPTTIAVTLTCKTTGSYIGSGIYTGLAGGTRVVTVSATSVPYTSLFGTLGLSSGGSLTLNAQSEVPVMGI